MSASPSQSLPLVVNQAEQWSHINNASSPTLRSPVSKLSRMWSTMNDVPFVAKITSPSASTSSISPSVSASKMTETSLQNQHLLSQGFRLLSSVMTNEYQDNLGRRAEFDTIAIRTMERELANERPLLIHSHNQYVMLLLGYNRNEQMFSGYVTKYLNHDNCYDDVLTYSDRVLSYADAKRAFNIVLGGMRNTSTSAVVGPTTPVFVYGFDKLDQSLWVDPSAAANKKELVDADLVGLKVYSPIMKPMTRSNDNNNTSLSMSRHIPTSPIALTLPQSVLDRVNGDKSTSAPSSSPSPSASLFVQSLGQSSQPSANDIAIQQQFQFPLLKPLSIVPNSNSYSYDNHHMYDIDNASPKTIVIDLPDSNELGTVVRANHIIESSSSALPSNVGISSASQALPPRQNSAFGNSVNATTLLSASSSQQQQQQQQLIKPVPVVVPMAPTMHHVVQRYTPPPPPPAPAPVRRSPAPAQVRRSPARPHQMMRSPPPQMRRASPSRTSPARAPPPRRVSPSRASPHQRAPIRRGSPQRPAPRRPQPPPVRRRPAARLARRTSAIIKKIFGRVASPRRR